MVKMAYVNPSSYAVGVYDDFLGEFFAAPIRRANGTVITRAHDGYVPTDEMRAVVELLNRAGYVVASDWENTGGVVRAVVTSDTAGFQPREHGVPCPFHRADQLPHLTWHHSGICDEHSLYRNMG